MMPNLNDSTPGSPLARSTTSSQKSAPRGGAYFSRDPDSSDEDDKLQDELITGFDQFGVQRCVDSFHLVTLAAISTHNSPTYQLFS